MKRLYEGNEVNELRSTFEEKPGEAKPSPDDEEEDSKGNGETDKADTVPTEEESGASSMN